MTLTADLRDKTFRDQPGAVFVTGMYSDPWMGQFPGAGPSPAPYSFKAILRDGILYVPDPHYTVNTPKRDRDYSNYPMVKATDQDVPGFALRPAR